MADGRSVPNLGSKVCRITFLNGVVATGNFTELDTSKLLISVGKMICMGHSVSMISKGRSHPVEGWTRSTIYHHQNSVWKILT